jgi:hypothetical protein
MNTPCHMKYNITSITPKLIAFAACGVSKATLFSVLHPNHLQVHFHLSSFEKFFPNKKPFRYMYFYESILTWTLKMKKEDLANMVAFYDKCILFCFPACLSSYLMRSQGGLW